MQLSLLEPPPDIPRTSGPLGHRLTREDLGSYIPEAAIDYILRWFETNPVRLRVAPGRSSKFGDYRTTKPGTKAIISVNKTLNPYDFLITLVHEMAHDVVFSTFSTVRGHSLFRRKKDQPKPHGQEWKNHYRSLMIPLMIPAVFPHEVIVALQDYFLKANASAKANQNLAIALKKYDKPDGKEFLQDLPPDTIFYLPGGRAFRKKELLRKRYRCQSIANHRIYLFSPVATVSRNKT